MAAGVYAITCLVSGWQYIGYATKLKKKWMIHRSQLQQGIHRCKQLQTDWDKWGATSFIWQVLELVPSEGSNEMPHWLQLSFRAAYYQEQRYKQRNSHEYNTVEKKRLQFPGSI
jgi:hypothetical protein